MTVDREMTFGEHLDELRRRVILALAAIAIGSAVCGVFYRPILRRLFRPYAEAYYRLVRAEARSAFAAGAKDAKEDEEPPPDPDTLDYEGLREHYGHLVQRGQIEPGAPFTPYVTIIMVVVICGTILASPWVIYQAWAFIGAGLYVHERRYVFRILPFSYILFFGGAGGFFFFMLPVALQALLTPVEGLTVMGMPVVGKNYLMSDYFRFAALLSLVFGIVFQTPLVILFLARTGLVPLATLFRKQRIIILVMVVLSAMFTPPDPVTMVMMAIPLLALYWLGLLLAWLFEVRDRRRAARRRPSGPGAPPEEESPQEEPTE